jgi:hypothetical protein
MLEQWAPGAESIVPNVIKEEKMLCKTVTEMMKKVSIYELIDGRPALLTIPERRAFTPPFL